MKISQILVVLFLILNFFLSLWVDFNGREAKKPYGFMGAVITVLSILLLAIMFWQAGAFSTLHL